MIIIDKTNNQWLPLRERAGTISGGEFTPGVELATSQFNTDPCFHPVPPVELGGAPIHHHLFRSTEPVRMTIGDWIGLICLAGLVGFVGGGFAIFQLFFKKKEPEDSAAERLKEHFDSPLLEDLVVSKRTFPMGIRA